MIFFSFIIITLGWLSLCEADRFSFSPVVERSQTRRGESWWRKSFIKGTFLSTEGMLRSALLDVSLTGLARPVTGCTCTSYVSRSENKRKHEETFWMNLYMNRNGVSFYSTYCKQILRICDLTNIMLLWYMGLNYPRKHWRKVNWYLKMNTGLVLTVNF